MNSAIRSCMSTDHVRHHLECKFEIILSRRKRSEAMVYIPIECITIWLIDRAPQCTIFFQRFYRFADKLFEKRDRFCPFPSTRFIEPQWIGKMMQRDHRSQAALAQSTQHGAVTVQGVFIPGIRRWLDAAPLHRHAMGVLTGFGGAVEILFPAASPPVASQTRCPLRMTGLFPHPPLIVRVVAFHLVRGGGGPP